MRRWPWWKLMQILSSLQKSLQFSCQHSMTPACWQHNVGELAGWSPACKIMTTPWRSRMDAQVQPLWYPLPIDQLKVLLIMQILVSDHDASRPVHCRTPLYSYLPKNPMSLSMKQTSPTSVKKAGYTVALATCKCPVETGGSGLLMQSPWQWWPQVPPTAVCASLVAPLCHCLLLQGQGQWQVQVRQSLCSILQRQTSGHPDHHVQTLKKTNQWVTDNFPRENFYLTLWKGAAKAVSSCYLLLKNFKFKYWWQWPWYWNVTTLYQ